MSATTVVVGEGSFLPLRVLAKSQNAGFTPVFHVEIAIGNGVRSSFGFRENQKTSL